MFHVPQWALSLSRREVAYLKPTRSRYFHSSHLHQVSLLTNIIWEVANIHHLRTPTRNEEYLDLVRSCTLHETGALLHPPFSVNDNCILHTYLTWIYFEMRLMKWQNYLAYCDEVVKCIIDKLERCGDLPLTWGYVFPYWDIPDGNRRNTSIFCFSQYGIHSLTN